MKWAPPYTVLFMQGMLRREFWNYLFVLTSLAAVLITRFQEDKTEKRALDFTKVRMKQKHWDHSPEDLVAWGKFRFPADKIELIKIRDFHEVLKSFWKKWKKKVIKENIAKKAVQKLNLK